MLDDLLIQFFDAQARRETSVYLLLNGKKTLSILYAAMVHHQLQWLQLYPTLERENYQAAITRLRAQGLLVATDAGLVLADDAAQKAAAKRVPLPSHYHPDLAVHEFAPRLQLAVQVLSEASYHERHYRPIVQDWAVQQAVRRWWRHCDAAQAQATLQAAFAALPQQSGDALVRRFVGHQFVGSAKSLTLADQLAEVDRLAEFISVIAAGDLATPWAQLWGGRRALAPASAYQALTLIVRGYSRTQVAAQLRLKPSTINEHLLTVAIEGAVLPVAQLYTPAQRQMLQHQGAVADYRALLAAVPECDFFQVRLYQILQFQGRWPDGDA